jgi:hypothetical protein
VPCDVLGRISVRRHGDPQSQPLPRVHLSIAGANCNEGATQNNLGNALRTLGEHGSDTARLEAAVSAFRDVLKEFTRERAPAYQGIVQRSLEVAEKLLAARTCPVGRNGTLVLVGSWRHRGPVIQPSEDRRTAIGREGRGR